MKRFWTAVLLMAAVSVICISFMSAWQIMSRIDDGEYYVTTERGRVYENLEPAYRERVNINTATAGELQTVPQIGQKRAADIVEYREKNGDFESTADIMLVSGINEGTFAIIRDYITVEEDEK